MERYYKVGELAKLYGVSPDLLRYYEKKGLLHPKRLENGYRAYSVREVWRLNVIRDLRALDLPVEIIARYLEDHSAATTRTLLEDELALLDEQIARLQTLRAGVSRRLKAADRAYARPQGVCELQTLPPRRCHSLAAPYRTDAEMDPLLQELRRFDPEHLYVWGNDGIGSYLSLASARKGRCQDYTGVFMLHPAGETTLPGGDWLTLTYRGPNSQNDEFLPRLLAEAEARGRTPDGLLLEVLLVDIHSSANDADHVTELQMHLAPAEPADET